MTILELQQPTYLPGKQNHRILQNTWKHFHSPIGNILFVLFYMCIWSPPLPLTSVTSKIFCLANFPTENFQNRSPSTDRHHADLCLQWSKHAEGQELHAESFPEQEDQKWCLNSGHLQSSLAGCLAVGEKSAQSAADKQVPKEIKYIQLHRTMTPGKIQRKRKKKKKLFPHLLFNSCSFLLSHPTWKDIF